MFSFDRIYGALLGLAVGDAIAYPALFHRIASLPEKRRPRIWNVNRELREQHIARLYMPYTHREPAALLEPAPSDDTEWALLSARALLDEKGEPTQQSFLNAWHRYVLSVPLDTLQMGFSERAAIENLRRGLLPPATGNDNPQHYEDGATVRAVVSGLYYVGQPEKAAQLAQADAEITNAEDGIYAARAMATAIALLAAGASLGDALATARAQFPAESWLAYNDAIALDCLRESSSPLELALHLARRISNTVYTFGNVAPETLPAAFVICEATHGDVQQAILVANAIPKVADSLPALVGALCGVRGGAEAMPATWRAAVNEVRGVCLPTMKRLRLNEVAEALLRR